MSYKICFLQVDSPEITEYSKYTFEINKNYCNLHGYDFLNLSAIKTNEYWPSWSKFFHTKNILETTNFTHIFYLDADAIILNSSIKLEDIIKKMKKPIAFSQDSHNIANSGSFIASKESLHVINAIIEFSIKNPKSKLDYPWEQKVIDNLYKNEGHDQHIQIFPTNTINSSMNLYKQDRKQFIFHFMARKLEDKICIAKKFYKSFLLINKIKIQKQAIPKITKPKLNLPKRNFQK
jgi:hypothetical protein